MATVAPGPTATPADSFTPKSSFLTLCEYEPTSRTMTVTFKTGGQHRYLYVFPATWLSFKESKDHSSYYANAIKGKLMSIPVIRKDVGQPRPKSLKENRSPENVGIFNAGVREPERKRERQPAGAAQHRRPGNIPAALAR